MRTLVAYFALTASAFSADLSVNERQLPLVTGQEISIERSENVDVILMDDGRVKLSYPEYRVLDSTGNRSKAIVSNSFRVPLNRAETRVFSSQGVFFPEGTHTFYFDWVDPIEALRAEDDPGGFSGAISNAKHGTSASEFVVIDIVNQSANGSPSVLVPRISSASDSLSEKMLNEMVQLPPNKRLVSVHADAEVSLEGAGGATPVAQSHMVNPWRDGALQWTNGAAIYQHIDALEQQYVRAQNDRVVTVGGDASSDVVNAKQGISGRPAVHSTDGSLSQTPVPSFEMLRSEGFFSLLVGDTYTYQGQGENSDGVNGVLTGAATLGQLKGRLDASIRYPNFSYQTNNAIFPGYPNGTAPALGLRGTSEVSRIGSANSGQRNVLKQLESRKPIVLFTEGSQGGSIVVQFPFAAMDQKVRYSIFERNQEYTVEHVGPTLGVYLLEDAAASPETGSESFSSKGKEPISSDEADLALQQLQSINFSNKSPFSPGLTPAEKVKSLLGKKNPDSSGMSLMSLISTAPAERAGLRAEYFNDQSLTGTPQFIRTDSTVDFTWGTNSPGTPLVPGLFSVRWRGMVEAQYDETYTFYTNTSDGVRLWVNGMLLVDNWTNHSVVENSGSIVLKAGQKYNIMMLYYKNSGGNATAQLSWSSPSTSKAIIPSDCLFPPGGAAPVITSKEFSSGYGFKLGAWTLEPSTKNRPTTQGDFTVSTAFSGASLFSAYGPTFGNRKFANGALAGGDQSGQSQGLSITVTGSWAGTIPGGSNYQTSLVIDSIKVRGLKWGTGSTVSISWQETTPGHTGSSSPQSVVSVPTVLANMRDANNYRTLDWNPPDVYVPGTSMSRTFTITASDGTNIPLDALEIVAHVKVTSDPPALESLAFSSGYGYAIDAVDPNTAKWKLEASGLNTPTTQGDFTVTQQFASQPLFSSYGPLFTNRALENGPVGGNGKSALSTSLAITVNAIWSGSVPNTANHRIALVIDSISVHGVKWIGSSPTGPIIGLKIVETTRSPAVSSSFTNLQNTGNPLSNLGDKLKYTKVSWDPDDYYVDGTSTSRTFTVTASDGSAIALDGVEIDARVVIGFDNDAWNTSFENGLADWNVLPITVPSQLPGRSDFAEVNENRVIDGERSLQLVADNYSPNITVVSTMQPLLPNTPYQQFSYSYFYEHFQRPGVPPDDYARRKFGSRLRLYDSTGAAITGGVFDRPGGYISDGNWFPAVRQIEVPSNASFYTLEFYWTERTGKVAFDDIRHTPIAHAPVATATGVKLTSFSDASRDLWVASPMEKIYQNVPVPAASPAATKIQMSAARGESQSIQLVYRPKYAEMFTSISVGNLTKTGGQTIASSNISFRYVNYLNIAINSPDDDGYVHPSTFGQLGWTPDPLRPYVPEDPAQPTTPGSLPANVSLPIWITVDVPASTLPGVYAGTVVLTTGSTTKNIPFEVEVFGFTIPDKPSMKIAASNGGAHLNNRTKLRQRLKANRIFSEMSHSGGTSSLPITVNPDYSVTINWTSWDTMMTQYQGTDGMTYFQVPSLQLGDISGPGNGGNWLNNPALSFGSPAWRTALTSYVTQVYQHLTDPSKPAGWLGYSVWKIWDEPFRSELGEMVAEVAEIVRANAPNAKICVTSWPQPSLYDTPIDIWLQPMQTFEKELPTPVTEANESWIYNNDLYLVDRPWGLTDMRNNAWWMWKNDVKGLLWWNVAHGWGSSFETDQDSYEGQDGGGNLFYSGATYADVDDSMRVASFRDSVDDYDYFTLLSSAQDERKSALSLALAPTGKDLVLALIDGVEGKNDPLAIERSRFLAARLISFLKLNLAPATFDLDSNYLTTNQLKGYVSSGTTIVNGTIPITLGPNNSFTIVDFRQPTVFTKSGVTYMLPAAP